MDEPYSIPGDWNRCKTYHLNFYDTDPTQHVGFTAPQPPQRYGDMYSLNDSFGGWTVIKADALTYPAVMDALQRGAYYATTGPELHELYIKDNALHVKCSPVEKIYVVTESRSCKMKLANVGETIDEAVFPLTGNEGYIRVDCRDASGRHAYSNAYRFNVL